MKKKFYFAAFICATICTLVLLPGCRKETAQEFKIDLPATPVLTMRSNWAVVASSHLRLREKASIQSHAVTTLWQNNVLEIISRDEVQQEVEGKTGYWYKVAYDGLQGWVFGAYLQMYESENEARRAAQKARSE
ncbi:MAG: SH3 domain-containing protein [bacterium]